MSALAVAAPDPRGPDPLGPDPLGPDPLGDARLAARLCAIDPAGLGGMLLRGGGDARDAVLATLRAALPATAPWRRLPVGVDDEQLLGGLDLGATLGRGTAVWRAGLLAETDGGIVVVPMAERLPAAAAARLAAALDTRDVAGPGGGGAARRPARIAVVLLDDGADDDERPAAALAERLAFHLDLDGVRLIGREVAMPVPGGPPVDPPDAAVLAALVAAAAAFGIDSARAPLMALRAARAAATAAGRRAIEEADVVLAARLVLAPRATRLPADAAPPADAPAAPPDRPDATDAPGAAPDPPPDRDGAEDEQGADAALADRVLAATRAALPADVMARIDAAGATKAATSRARGAGERRRSAQRGRPLGARAGVPRGGTRLSLIDTLRAAAPWQPLRRRGDDDEPRRIRVRRDDLRIRRFETRAEATTIFAVDASGSSALARLAEAKGAVELLLAEAYVQRAQVALIAFRGRSAELLLPPTRSLARARRSLAELPGGGGTPLAAGLDAARAVGLAVRARGRTPFVVVLTDGRANIAADGGMVRLTAEQDALAAARAIGAAGLAAAFIDTSARPRPEGARLAAAMRARYLPLPRADAAAMHAAVRAAQPPTARR